MSTKNVVVEGECLASIAEANGFYWRTLWDDPGNAELRKVRDSPYVLLPGDEVTIPDRRAGQARCVTGKRHVFRRKGVPARFQVRLRREGEPRRSIPYTIAVDDLPVRSGSTSEDGVLIEWIPPGARAARVRLEDNTEHEFLFGMLDPVSDLAGVAARLRNLGYLRDDSADGLLEAVMAFQAAAGLVVTGDLDEATRSRLQTMHGS